MKRTRFFRLLAAALALTLLLAPAAAGVVPEAGSAAEAELDPLLGIEVEPPGEPGTGLGPEPEPEPEPEPPVGAGETLLRTRREVGGGLSYINTVSLHPSLGREESFTLLLAPESGAYPIAVQGDGTVYYPGDVANAIALAQARGYNVLAAVNSDFYAMATGVPLGLAVENGRLLSSGGGEPAVAFTQSGAALVENTDIEMTLTNDATGAVCVPMRYNKYFSPNYGLWLLDSNFSAVSSRTSGDCWFVKLRLLEGEPAPNGAVSLEVEETARCNGAFPLEEGYLYLTAGNLANQEAAFASFQPGDPVTFTTQCEDEALACAQWATGCGDILVRDGALTDPEGWDPELLRPAPRTALGVREDGALVLHVADGRRPSYSQGLTLEDLAQQLLDLGCVWAVNLDGGGSSVMSVRLPGTEGCQVVNRPSDNTPRRCASYLMLVTDDMGDGAPAGLALSCDGSVALTGSSLELGEAIAFDSGLNPVEADLSDLAIVSATGLGTVENGVYTAGPTPGVETILFYSDAAGLFGTAQLWLTDTLTAFTAAPEVLVLGSEERTPLSAVGYFWSRLALRGPTGVFYRVEGEVGTVDAGGLFTAAGQSGSGTVTAEAGGLSASLSVLVYSVHRDVTEENWSYEAVEYCYQAGITTGVSGTLFGRENEITRADFVVMLYRAVGSPAVEGELPFSDVAPEDYYAPAILWAWQNGITSGMGDGSFGVDSHITREDAFTILGRALPLLGFEPRPEDETLLEGYTDAELLSDYARAPVGALTAVGVVRGGDDGLLRCADPITREQTAAILYRCLTAPREAPAPEASKEAGPDGTADEDPGMTSETEPGEASEAEASEAESGETSEAGDGE